MAGTHAGRNFNVVAGSPVLEADSLVQSSPWKVCIKGFCLEMLARLCFVLLLLLLLLLFLSSCRQLGGLLGRYTSQSPHIKLLNLEKFRISMTASLT